MSCNFSKSAVEQELLKDLRTLGLPVDTFEFRLKDYSATRYGCYRVNTNRVYVYLYSNKECTDVYPYAHLLETSVHEAIHAMQWHDPQFKRVKGVMHDSEFYSLQRYYFNKIQELNLDEKVTRFIGQSRRDAIQYYIKNFNCPVPCGVALRNSPVLCRTKRGKD